MLRRIIAVTLLVILPTAAHAAVGRWTSGGPSGGNFERFVFDPGQPSVIYASGTHLYRTTNSGASWKRLGLADEGLVARIPAGEPSVLIAAAYSVFRSTDRGDSWRSISSVPFQKDFLRDFEFEGTGSQVLYGVSNVNGVYKSTDGGATWMLKNSGIQKAAASLYGTIAVEVDPTAAGVAYVLVRNGKVFKTVDGGNSWQLASSGLNAGKVARALKMDPRNRQVLYVAGESDVFKSANAGASWSSTRCNCDVRGLALDPRSDTIYAVGDDAVRSTNGGATWSRITSLPRLADTLLLGAAVSPADSRVVFVGAQREGVFRSANGSTSFQRVNVGLDSLPVGSVATQKQRPSDILAAGQLQVFRSANSGNQWSLLFKGVSPLDWVTDVRYHPQDPNLIGVAGCCTAAISTNGGGSWRPIRFAVNGEITESRYIVFDPQNRNTVYIVPETQQSRPLGVARSTDAGGSFRIVNTGLTDLDVRSIAVDPASGSNVFVGTKSGKVFRTSSGGAAWAASSAGLSGAGRINSIAVDPTRSKVVYLASSAGGVYKSTNGGQTWARKNNGLPAPSRFEYRFVAVDPANPHTLYCGGTGIFVSTDEGEHWSAFDSRGLIDDSFLYTMTFQPAQPGVLFLGTERGVFSYSKAASNVPTLPVIDQVYPASGRPGDTLAINGSNFGSTQGASLVLYNGAPTSAIEWTAKQVLINLPSGATSGQVSLQVNKAGSNGFEVLVDPPPQGTLEPTSGSASGGTLVTLRDNSGAASTLRFVVVFGQAVARDVRFIPPDKVVCTAPPGSGTVEVHIVALYMAAYIGNYTYQ